MLTQRQSEILRAVVEEFIETAQPVGSSHVTRAPGIDVSSATVRNEMAALEHEGFLHQPHTSAGRVPTEHGYRHYVDTLIEPTALRGHAHVEVKQFFDRAHGEIERMLADTSHLLSGLTDCAAVVVGPPYAGATIHSVQLVGLGARVALLVVVLSNGVVDKYTIELAEEVSEEDLARAGELLATLVEGRSTDTTVQADEVEGQPAAVTAVVEQSLQALRPDTSDHDAEHVFVDGASRVANAFEAVDTVRQILGILEQQLVVVSLVRDVLDRGLSVAIGTETGMQPLNECALVVAPYEVDGAPAGTIGVLGPTRMDYPQALAAVAVVSQNLGFRLTEG